MKALALIVALVACGGDMADTNGNRPFSKALDRTRTLGAQDAKYANPIGMFLPDSPQNFRLEACASGNFQPEGGDGFMMLTRLRDINASFWAAAIVAFHGNSTTAAFVFHGMALYEIVRLGSTSSLRLVQGTQGWVKTTDAAAGISPLAIVRFAQPVLLDKTRRYMVASVLGDADVDDAVRASLPTTTGTGVAGATIMQGLYVNSSITTGADLPEVITIDASEGGIQPIAGRTLLWQAVVPIDAFDVVREANPATLINGNEFLL